MSKRNLTKQQKRNIEQQQHVDLKNAQPGMIIAHYGDSVTIELTDGRLLTCNLRQNLPPLVVGDQIACEITNSDRSIGIVLALEPRRTEMWRKNQRGEKKFIAANISQIIIAVASEPVRSEQVLDRYLIIAELQNIPAMIIFNKIDLLTADQLAEKKYAYANYEKLGYPVYFISNKTQAGIESLNTKLVKQVSVIVGLSGTGKSSLIKTLLPAEEIRIGELSSASQNKLGQHTTTTARYYHLPAGGALIDSPGVREFALHDLTQQEIEHGFREFSPYLGQCKFSNCQHKNEPDCALLNALKAGKISAQRWAAYQKMLIRN